MDRRRRRTTTTNDNKICTWISLIMKVITKRKRWRSDKSQNSFSKTLPCLVHNHRYSVRIVVLNLCHKYICRNINMAYSHILFSLEFNSWEILLKVVVTHTLCYTCSGWRSGWKIAWHSDYYRCNSHYVEQNLLMARVPEEIPLLLCELGKKEQNYIKVFGWY